MQIADATVRMVASYFNIDVSVKITPTHMCEEDNAYVHRVNDDWNEYEIEVNPEFLKKCSEQELVEVISHEMVHVKQYECDDLDLGVRTTFFKGAFYDEEVEGYWFLPWEVEARGYERAFWALYTEKWEDYV